MADLRGGDAEDFQEEEVWAMMTARQGSKSRKKPSPSSSSSAWRASRTIPMSTPPHQSSAPVNIPDWSKILKEKPRKNLWDDACDAHHADDGGQSMFRHGYTNSDDEEEEDDDGKRPHEYLARRLASTQIASFSMCEGVGRTLKGRDLSKLRNAILTKTGFLE